MRVSTRGVGRDHDPDALDARADRLDAAARVVAQWRELDVRRLVAELRETAALLRRFANDLRLLDAFLRAARLLAPRDGDDDQGDRVA